MPKLPTLNGKQLVKYLESINFKVIRKKGSHVRLKTEDGKITTVPLHGKKDIPKGLLRKIIREDLEMSFEEFIKDFSKFK
jgi:predicted RNA binding protein YcfA (HicA-like mRNA interferase family)